MSTVSKTGNPELLVMADKLLRNGKPAEALDTVCRYRDDCINVPSLPTEYYMLRAIAGFLLADDNGKVQDAEGYVKDAGGASPELQDLYRQALSAFARHGRPLFGRKKRLRYDGAIRFNIDRIGKMTDEIGGDGHGVSQDIAEITPK